MLANDGMHIAGTDFDTRLHLAWVMPVLGYGSTSTKGLAMPSPLYFDLSTWHRINLLYGAAPARCCASFASSSSTSRVRAAAQGRASGDGPRAPGAHGVREDRAVRSGAHGDRPSHIEAGLAVDVARDHLQTLLVATFSRASSTMGTEYRACGGTCAGRDLDGVLHRRIERHAALRDAFVPAFPQSRIAVGDLFGSVVSGLGIDAARRFR